MDSKIKAANYLLWPLIGKNFQAEAQAGVLKHTDEWTELCLPPTQVRQAPHTFPRPGPQPPTAAYTCKALSRSALRVTPKRKDILVRTQN